MEGPRIHDRPLQLARDPTSGVVVIYTPAGERCVLSAAAALLSARDLARAARRARRRCRDRAVVISVRFDPWHHWAQRRRQARQDQGTRKAVAALLLPVAIAIAGAMVLGGMLLLGSGTVLALGPLLLLAALALATPLAWLTAPAVMSCDEISRPPPRGIRPRLAASEGVAAM